MQKTNPPIKECQIYMVMPEVDEAAAEAYALCT